MLNETKQYLETVRTRERCVLSASESAFEAAVDEAGAQLAEAYGLLASLRRCMRREEAAGDPEVRGRLCELEQKLMVIEAAGKDFQKHGERFLAGLRELGQVERTLRADFALQGEDGIHTEDVAELMTKRERMVGRTGVG